MLSLLIEESSCSSLGGIESVRRGFREYVRMAHIVKEMNDEKNTINCVIGTYINNFCCH